ncbi:MAG: peptidoglycan DD-metalloendopeptidase family protein [Micromonosporaceae bacterium]|nr:peptidoglycan DD-metalloendopeptidase family protein [Micromonosporaceae bacterium]
MKASVSPRRRSPVLEKFTRTPLTGLADRARIDVIRHRMVSRLGGRGRSLLAVAGALALIGVGTVAANAAVPDHDPPAAAAEVGIGDQPAVLDRADSADRADRSERGEPGDPDESSESTESGSTKGAEPEESPEPAPSPAESEAAESESEPEETQEQADWVHPMPGASTTSCFGWRSGVLHAGVDLAAPHGTPIRAVGAGTVTDAGWVFGGYGISVVVDHGNGYYTHYAHASEARVSPGDRVSPGQTIALEGSTGDSSGPHLHFEVHQGMWNQVEPTAWLSGRGVDIGGC